MAEEHDLTPLLRQLDDLVPQPRCVNPHGLIGVDARELDAEAEALHIGPELAHVQRVPLGQQPRDQEIGQVRPSDIVWEGERLERLSGESLLRPPECGEQPLELRRPVEARRLTLALRGAGVDARSAIVPFGAALLGRVTRRRDDLLLEEPANVVLGVGLQVGVDPRPGL